MHRRTFLLTVAAAATGCTMGPQRRPNPFDAQGGGNSIKIEVVNRNFNQATLVALSPVRRRIGIVGGNSSQSFSFAWSSGDQLRIHIDLLAGAAPRPTRSPSSPERPPTWWLRIPSTGRC